MNVTLPERTYVDLYAETGITVGVQIEVLNIATNDVRLYATASTPDPKSDDHLPLAKDREAARNQIGDPGAWAISVAGGAVDVREV
jgi:hypothetical protein